MVGAGIAVAVSAGMGDAVPVGDDGAGKGDEVGTVSAGLEQAVSITTRRTQETNLCIAPPSQ